MVKRITATATYFIRKEVLRKGIDKPYQFKGDFASDTFHLGVFYEKVLVGIATFMQQECTLLKGRQYQLRGMAVLPKAKGKGLGTLLLKTAFKELKNRQVNYVWCNAREVAVEFYQKNNFKIIEQPFEINQIGLHFKMYKKL